MVGVQLNLAYITVQLWKYDNFWYLLLTNELIFIMLCLGHLQHHWPYLCQFFFMAKINSVKMCVFHCLQVWHAPDLQGCSQLVCSGGAHGGQAAGEQRKMLLVRRAALTWPAHGEGLSVTMKAILWRSTRLLSESKRWRPNCCAHAQRKSRSQRICPAKWYYPGALRPPPWATLVIALSHWDEWLAASKVKSHTQRTTLGRCWCCRLYKTTAVGVLLKWRRLNELVVSEGPLW